MFARRRQPRSTPSGSRWLSSPAAPCSRALPDPKRQHHQAGERAFVFDARLAHHPRNAAASVPVFDVPVAASELLGIHRHRFAARKAGVSGGRQRPAVAGLPVRGGPDEVLGAGLSHGARVAAHGTAGKHFFQQNQYRTDVFDVRRSASVRLCDTRDRLDLKRFPPESGIAFGGRDGVRRTTAGVRERQVRAGGNQPPHYGPEPFLVLHHRAQRRH